MWFVGSILLTVILFIAWKGWTGAAKAVAGATVNAAGGLVAGTAEGLGEQVGLPVTNPEQCELYITAGDTLHASVYCSAGRFIKYLATGK